MVRALCSKVTGIGVIATLSLAATVRAGFVDDLALGLRYIGFDIQSQQMPLSGGTDLLVSRNFVGNPQDFGPWDITLQGPLSFSLNTGGNVVKELEIGINTAVNENVASTPLTYVINYDVGGQEAQVTGNLLLDTNIAINNFGFYEMSVAYSSRQTVVREGRFANDEQDFDFDVGPIVVEGNIYADILAVITQPLFDAAGQPNPFANFSEISKLNDILQIGFTDLEERLASGLADPDALVSGASLLVPNSVAYVPQSVIPAAAAGFIVPEPAMLALMLAGVGVLILRRPRSLSS